MSHAIIRSGGKQFRVEKDSTVLLPLMDKEIGAAIELDVLSVVGQDDDPAASENHGRPAVSRRKFFDEVHGTVHVK